MARTTFSGPVASDNGFEGSLVITTAPNTITTTNTATSGTYQPLVVSTTMSGAGADGGRAKFDMTTNVALGSFSNALKAEVTYGASGRTTGLGSAFVAEMTLSAGTSAGTYAPVEIELNLGTSASTGTASSLVFASVNGTGKAAMDDNGYFLNLAGVTAGASKLFANNGSIGNVDEITNGLKVRIAGADYFILLATAANFAD
jgi:hypothetical protein